MKHLTRRINTQKREQANKSAQKFLHDVTGLPKGVYELVVRKPVRTSPQNKALHLFCKYVSEALNESHNYNKIDLLGGVEVMWTMESVKESLLKPVVYQETGKRSTSKLDTSELTRSVDKLQDVLAQIGIIVHFPSIDALQRDIVPYEIV